MNLLVDTGCDNSIIDKNIIDLLVTTKDTPSIKGIVSVTGTDTEAISACRIDFTLNDVPYTHKFHCIDFQDSSKMFEENYNIRIRGLLGSDFLSKYKLLVNFEDRTLDKFGYGTSN